MPPKVSVVVVSWNSAGYIRSCLDSVLRQSYANISCLVVDNGSTDASPSMVKGGYSGVTLIENTWNAGYCRALNQGIRKEESDFVLSLNPDVRLEDDYIERAVETLERFPECGMLSGKILRPDGKTLDSAGQLLGRDRRPRERGYGRPDAGQYNSTEHVLSVCGAAALYRRRMLEEIAISGQYFDEDYFAFYEDLDVGWRGQLSGWRCIYEPMAVAYHERGGTASGQDTPFFLRGRQFARRPPAIKYHIVKNRYMTIMKNDSLEGLLADLPAVLLFEMALWSAVLVLSPTVFLLLPKMAREVLRAREKRKTVQARRKVGHQKIREWIA